MFHRHIRRRLRVLKDETAKERPWVVVRWDGHVLDSFYYWQYAMGFALGYSSSWFDYQAALKEGMVSPDGKARFAE
jgi:hypothetical protein